MRRESGMTLTELMVVLLLITVMVAASIPAFFHLRKMSAEREMRETVKAVESRVAAWHYQELMVSNREAYPETLDANPERSVCVQCFEKVMEKGLESELWFKESPTEYRFSANRNSGNPKAYGEKDDYRISYNPADGSVTASLIE